MRKVCPVLFLVILFTCTDLQGFDNLESCIKMPHKVFTTASWATIVIAIKVLSMKDALRRRFAQKVLFFMFLFTHIDLQGYIHV